ncbi:hypothetical protein NLJ89_g11450 [Agrocybe chaxingu]|uniref:Uncharacterized protein n=1 Tax=Agrocybe chaxingu TaxID=84603 RepID=A0A9W8JPZ5_9AGAR|nr:hypothetical protein NLJ89_g11450 [Agrocybe chaxingu]
MVMMTDKSLSRKSRGPWAWDSLEATSEPVRNRIPTFDYTLHRSDDDKPASRVSLAQFWPLLTPTTTGCAVLRLTAFLLGNQSKRRMCARATLIRVLLVVSSFFTEGTMAVGGALVARQGTSTSAAPSPSITLTPDFTFTDPQIQPFTCQSATIFWFYNGPESPLSLVVTNVAGGSPYLMKLALSPTGAAEPSSITTIIASSLDPGAMTYTWTSVNVPQGWYILTASLPERAYSVNSQPFFIHPGSSTACLPAVTSSSSTSSTATGSPSTTTTTIPVGASAPPSASARL